MQKKKKNWGNFFSPEKKGNLRAIFRDGQRSVAEPGPTPSPWSIHPQAVLIKNFILLII